MPGGQPSITQPMAGPWDSPKLVTANRFPKVLPLMVWIIPDRIDSGRLKDRLQGPQRFFQRGGVARAHFFHQPYLVKRTDLIQQNKPRFPLESNGNAKPG